MEYLLGQMFICLLIAFLLGMILGWLLCKMFKCCKRKSESCGIGETSCSVDPVVMPAAAVIDADADVEDLDSDVDLDGDAYKIETLEGVGPKTGDLFRGYGVATVGDYLRKLHSPLRRERAADDLGILAKPLHEWASMSDLLRISGVDHQDAELLFASGVLTVSDLAEQSAGDLVSELERVNNAGKQLISPVVPLEDDVRSWIASARGTNAVVSV